MLSKGGSSGKKYSVLDASIDADNSIMIIDETMLDDPDDSNLVTNRSSISSAGSPRKIPASELNGGT